MGIAVQGSLANGEPSRDPRGAIFGRSALPLLMAALVLAALSAWWAGVAAAGEGGGSAPTRTVRIGMTEAPPLLFFADGKPSGLVAEFLDSVAAQNGWRLVYTAGAWPELLAKLEAGELDLVPVIAYSRDRARQFDFTLIPTIDNWGVVLAPAGRDIHSIFDLPGLRIAGVAAGIYTAGLQEMLQEFAIDYRPVPAADNVDAVALVLDGLADVVVTSRLSADHLLRDGKLVETDIAFLPTQLRMATPKGRGDDLRAVLDSQLMAQKADGGSAFNIAQDRWIGAPRRSAFLVWIEYLAAALVLLLLAAGIASYVLKRQVNRRTVELANAVARVQAREAQINSIIEHQADAVVIVGGDGIMRFANAKAEEYLGKSRRALLGKPFGLPIIAGESTELDLIQPGGGTLPVEMRAQDFIYEGQPALLASLRNIRERKEAERARLESEDRLSHSQKMEAVGQLTGGIAHDFNNILGVILGNLQLLQRRLPGDMTTQRQIERALRAVQRGADLTRRLLVFSRRQNLEPKVIDVGDLLDELLKLIARTIGGAVEIRLSLDTGLWRVCIDPGQLENAVLNLCVNARDAMPEGGLLTIEAGNRRVPSATETRDGIEPGDYVRLAISDTGIGMADEIRAQIFEPFFTTKERDKGTGLGLSMVYGFVKQSGGHISVQSRPGSGTTMQMLLPRTEAAPSAAAQGSSEAALPAAGGECVLLVDDDEALRETIAALLASLGYTVVQASSGPQALAMLDGPGAPDVDVLLTDVIMPGGMNGFELVAAIRRSQPDLPALIQSGFTETAMVDDDALDPRTGFVEKPATALLISRKLRELLDE